MAHTWTVNGKTYYYKTEALLNAASPSDIIFNVENGEAFDNVEWDKEPEESWEDMLHIRAQQIRDSNNYVRIWYSGGADSHTMLKAFIDNNIWPDEIACVRYSLDNSFDGRVNQEINNGAIPYLQSLNLPESVKVTIVDIDGRKYLHFLQRSYRDDRVRRTDTAYSLKPSSDKWFDLMPQMFVSDSSKRADVFGNNKAKPYVIDNKWFIAIHDCNYGSMDISAHNNILETPFYTTPDYPELHCKQAHLVKNYLQKKFKGKNIKNQDIQNFYKHMFFGNLALTGQSILERTKLFAASRDISTQCVSLGKATYGDNVKIWDRILRDYTDQNNQTLALYNKIIKTNLNGAFKYCGLYGAKRHRTLYKRYCLGK